MGRILFVSTSTTVGGAEKTLFHLATGLNPNRFEAALISLKPAGPYFDKIAAVGIAAESLNLQGWPGPKHVLALKNIVESRKPDIVHAFMYQAIQLCRLAKACLPPDKRFKLVSSPRVGYRTRSFLSLLVDKSLRDLDDMLIAESDASRRHLLDTLGYSSTRVKLVYNGVEAFAAAARRQAMRSQFQVGPDEILIGSAGRLDKQKGFSVLLKALARLKNALAVKTVILGEGPLRAELERSIRKLGLESNVRLLGERKDAADCYSAFDIFVLPSLWEGLPNALLEAMSAGLPCLATGVDGVPEAVDSGKNGLLVPASDSKALAEGLAALAGNPALRRQLGSSAAETAGRRFGLKRMVAEYEEIYAETLGGLPPQPRNS